MATWYGLTELLGNGCRQSIARRDTESADIWIEAHEPSQDIASLSLEDAGFVSVLSMPAISFTAKVFHELVPS